MYRLERMILVFIVSLAFLACQDWVTSLDPFIDSIEDRELNSPDKIPFLIRGVQQQFSYTIDDLFVNVAGLSDEFIFDLRTPTAVFPQFGEIDQGLILLTNYQIEAINSNIGRLRFLADDLLERVKKMSGVDESAMRNVQFTGNFYGGIARYLAATYLGLEPTRGGAPIDNGPFIPSDQLYDLAIEKFQAALQYATADEKRVVYSMMAKTYLYKGDYQNALNAALSGLEMGDPPFQALYTSQEPNYFDIEAGSQRHQYTADSRFKAYVDEDPAESARIPLEPIKSLDGSTEFYIQKKYPASDSPIPFVTWQEIYLIRAECALRGFGNDDPTALINAVRASHGIAPISGTANMDVLIKERDKELFLTGARLPDQRRFNLWHLGPGTWQYIPIDQRERDYNPNL